MTSSSFGLQPLSAALPEIETSRSLSSLIPASPEPQPIPTTTSDSSSTPVDNTDSSSAEATHREPSTTSNGETSDPVAVQDHASTSGPLYDACESFKHTRATAPDSAAARARRLRRPNQTALREPLQHSHKRREDKIPPAVRNAGPVARPKVCLSNLYREIGRLSDTRDFGSFSQDKRKSIQGRHHQVTASLSGLENVPSSKKGKNGRAVTSPSSATSSSPYSRRRERVFIARFSEEVVSCKNTTFVTSNDEIFCPVPVRLRRPLLPVDLPPETFGRKSPPPRPSTPYPRRSVSRPRPSTPDCPESIPSVSTSNTRSVTDIPPPPPPIPSSSPLLLQPEYAPETSYSESLQRSSASVSQPLPHTSKSPSNISVQHHVSTPNITSAPTNDFSMDVESDLYSHTASSTSVFAESFNPSHPPFGNAKPFPFQIAHSRPLRRQKTLAKTHLLTHQQVDLTSFTRHRRRLLLSIGPGKYLKNGAEGRVRKIKCSTRRFSVQECRSFNSGMSHLVKPPSWLRNEAPYTGLLRWTIRRRYLVCVIPERQALLTTSHFSTPTAYIISHYLQPQIDWNAHSSTGLDDTMDICLDDEGVEDVGMDFVLEQTTNTVYLWRQSSETNVFNNTWSTTSWPITSAPEPEPSSWELPVLDQASTMQMASAGLEPPSLLVGGRIFSCLEPNLTDDSNRFLSKWSGPSLLRLQKHHRVPRITRPH